MNIDKKIKILDFKLSKILNWWLFWAYKSLFSWSWMEFDEHSEYTFWNQLKDIDWKASSKTDNIFVKKYEEERDLNVLFIVDNTLSMQFWTQDKTKKETLEEVFYSLSLSAYYNNDNIWWLIFDEKGFEFLDYKKSKNNIYNVLDIVERKNNNEYKDFNKYNEIFKYLINRNIKDNLIFLMTDEVERIDEKLLRFISKNNEIVVINIFDNFENNLTDLPFELSLNLWKQFLNIDLWNKKKVEEYKKLRKDDITYIKALLNKNKSWYIDIDNKSDISKKLIEYFSKVKK